MEGSITGLLVQRGNHNVIYQLGENLEIIKSLDSKSENSDGKKITNIQEVLEDGLHSFRIYSGKDLIIEIFNQNVTVHYGLVE